MCLFSDLSISIVTDNFTLPFTIWLIRKSPFLELSIINFDIASLSNFSCEKSEIDKAIKYKINKFFFITI